MGYQSAVMPSVLVTQRSAGDVFVGAVVAHDADAADGEEDDEGLPDLVVFAGGLEFLDEDGVGGLGESRGVRR
jgi:hypothetical protein